MNGSKIAAMVVASATLSSCQPPSIIVDTCQQAGRTGFHITMPEKEAPQMDRLTMLAREDGSESWSRIWSIYTPTNDGRYNPFRSDIILYGDVPEGWLGGTLAPPIVEGISYEVRIEGGGADGETAFRYGMPLPECSIL